MKKALIFKIYTANKAVVSYGWPFIEFYDRLKFTGGTTMAQTQKKGGLMGKVKHFVGAASTGGMIGYAATILFFIPIPQTLVVVVGLVGGALVAKTTSKKE